MIGPLKQKKRGTCQIYKKFEFFHKESGRRDGVCSRCKECQKAKNAARRFKKGNKENKRNCYKDKRLNRPEAIKHGALKRLYSITYETLLNMISIQENLCAICKQPEKRIGKITNKPQFLSVDHDHKTGKVRELLCSRCNSVLGRMNENIDLFKLMIKYIKKHSKME